MFITLAIISLITSIICALMGMYISNDSIRLMKYSTLNGVLNIGYTILLYLTLFFLILSIITK